jgi:hypothetical protein
MQVARTFEQLLELHTLGAKDTIRHITIGKSAKYLRFGYHKYLRTDSGLHDTISIYQVLK